MMKKAYRVVVKVEIETLFNGSGTVSPSRMDHLAMVCTNLQNAGLQVLMVSSGAIVLGSAKLGLESQPKGVVQKQAVAAVGQAELMKLYQGYFDSYDQKVAQVLLTNDVITNPVRNKNARATFEKLLEKGIIAIINENDSVSTDDIIENDNYPLTLIVANLTDADAIVVKTARETDYQLVLQGSEMVYTVTEGELYRLVEDMNNDVYKVTGTIESFPQKIQRDHPWQGK
jgi:glutamate 5-kinase